MLCPSRNLSLPGCAAVTIENNVPPKQARALKSELESDFRPRRLTISGLGLHRYLAGPWKKLAIYAFRGS